MKFSLLSFILAALLATGCASNQSNNNSNTGDTAAKNSTNQQQPPTNGKKPELPPAPVLSQAKFQKPIDEQDRTPLPAANGKTAEALYQNLKNKGFKFGEVKTGLRMFGSEETCAFRDEQNIGYLIMRFADATKANQEFAHIDETYRAPGKWGRGLASKNFVIAVFGWQKGINKPQIIQLQDSDYQKLQAALDEFTAAS